MAPDLWAEGLAQPVRLALERARKRGVANAEEAIVAVDKAGPSHSDSSRDRPQAGRRPLGSGAGRPLQDGLATLAA